MAEYVHKEPSFVPVGGSVDLPKSGEIQCIVKFPVYSREAADETPDYWREAAGMAELEPCPFCGALYEKDPDDYWFSAHHESWCLLGHNGPYGSFIFCVDDIDNWNRRADNGN